MSDNMFHILVFDRSSKVDFHTYKRAFEAVAMIKQFNEAIEGSLPIGNPAVASYVDNICKRKLAWSYMTLSLKGAPAAILETTASRDPFDTWTALCSQHKPNTIEAYNQIMRDMENCILEEPKANPEPWMQQLNQYNARLQAIQTTYARDNVQMIQHILNKLPKALYLSFIITIMIQDTTTMTLEVFQDKVMQYWRNNVKSRWEDVEILMLAYQQQQLSQQTHHQGHQVYHPSCNFMNERVYKTQNQVQTPSLAPVN